MREQRRIVACLDGLRLTWGAARSHRMLRDHAVIAGRDVQERGVMSPGKAGR